MVSVTRPGVYSRSDERTGNGHIRRQLRRHRQAAHRPAQDGGGQQVPAHLDRSPRGGRDPHQAAGHRVAAADDARPAHEHHRQLPRRGHAHHRHRAQREHVLRDPHAQQGRRRDRDRLAAQRRAGAGGAHRGAHLRRHRARSTRTRSSSSARSTTPRRSSRASATSSRASRRTTSSAPRPLRTRSPSPQTTRTTTMRTTTTTMTTTTTTTTTKTTTRKGRLADCRQNGRQAWPNASDDPVIKQFRDQISDNDLKIIDADQQAAQAGEAAQGLQGAARRRVRRSRCASSGCSRS